MDKLPSKMKTAFCSFLVLVAVDGNSANECIASSAGTNFVFGIIGWGGRIPQLEFYLHITPVMEGPAHVRVTAPYLDFNRTYSVSNFTRVLLNATLLQTENGTQFKGVEVSADVNVSVSVFTGSADLLEGVLILPDTALGTHYVASSYGPSGTSEILIAGLYNSTDVRLSTATDGSFETFQIHKFERHQFKSYRDTSGSVIISNKPVAVFSGSTGSQVPIGIGNRQYLIEQMIPIKYWTTQFIITPVYPRNHFVLKIFAYHDTTEAFYYNSTSHSSIRMNKGSLKELLFGTDPVVIVANKPIYVMQYGHDGDNMDGDPFMSNVQGISQFRDTYNFATHNYNYDYGSSTIAVTILKNSTSGLLLNRRPMTNWNAIKVPVCPPLDQYITLFVNVSQTSYYQLRQRDGIEFGAVIYGRIGPTIGYGYPLGLTFVDTGCEIKKTTTTPAFVKTSTIGTHLGQKGEDTSWCFHCDGLTHLQYCDQVQKCQTQDEVCYVQKYHRGIGVNIFRSGCIRTEQCNNHSSNNGCMDCCHGNFCNTVGCGETGIPAPGQRGPLCFECTHKGESEDCNTVQLCHSNQACMVAKYEWGDNNFFYDMECRDLQGCSTETLPVVVKKRHVPVCSRCCHSDFCNMNCTSGNTGPALVG